MNDDGSLTIGLLGCGVVGGGVAERIFDGVRFDHRDVRLGRALVRDIAKTRTPTRVHDHLTVVAEDVLDDPRVDVVIECLGGVEPAARYVEKALRRGLPVITANKALVADRGAYLQSLASEFGATLSFEAAVGGAMPILKTLRHIVASDEILEVGGVVNGTTNHVLSAMEDGSSFDDAVKTAQRAGFAESDPSTDLDGIDAAHKLAILAATAFGVWPKWESIARRGIREITEEDIEFARSRRCRIKLTAWARRGGHNARSVVAAVGPTFVPLDHPFAAPQGAENVALIVAQHAGPIIVGGLGAGRGPTASAIIADLHDVVARITTTTTTTTTNAKKKESTHA